MKAVLLAGGLGTRLQPLTLDLPKPMIPLANRPLMSYVVGLLVQHGFTDITVLLYYQPEIIKKYFGSGKNSQARLTYVEATEDFGTAGAVRLAGVGDREPILVISADLVTNFDLTRVAKFHRQKKSLATMVLTRVPNPLPYGIVIRDKNDHIKKFLEKPSWSEVFSDTINAGIYLLEPEAVKNIPPHRAFDFSRDLFPKLLADKQALFGCVCQGYWKDIGRLEDYARSHLDVLSGQAGLPVAGQKQDGTDIWLAKNTTIASTAKLEGYCLIGSQTQIGSQVSLVNSSIGKNCMIGSGASLRDCVVWDGVEIGAEAKLEKAIVGQQVTIGKQANLTEGVVIGNQVTVGAGAVIQPFLKIWPRKIIEANSAVSRSMIWRERWTRSIFGSYGVTGACGVEITPQFAASLGAAYGTILGSGARVSCSRDSHRASRMIYRALIAGLLSTGVDVCNLEMVPIPINRYGVRSLKSNGGFHIRKSPFDHEIIDIKFFDPQGLDISSAVEKMIEQVFFAENFAVRKIDGVGELSYPFLRVAEEYKLGLMDYLQKQAATSFHVKLVIDYAFGCASQIFPFILGSCGLQAIALDAYIDETKITKSQADFENSLQQMSGIVKSVQAGLGVMLDTGAEKVFFCDERGALVDGNRALAALALLTLRSKKGAALGVPVRESRVIEDLARQCGGKVVRTKNSIRGMMEAAENSGLDFVGESQGGYIFPDFMPAFDGMLSVCKIAAYLSREQIKFSDLMAEIPPINLRHRELPCPANDKGLIMRMLIDQQHGADQLETIDGAKFWHGRDWALVLPDPVRPVVHLYAEADRPRQTGQLMEKYARKINNIVGGK